LVSIRKVQFYLEEVKVLLTSNEEFARQTNAETVAMVLLIKHFFREEYAALQAKTSPLKIFLFKTEEGPLTLLELADRYRQTAAGGAGSAGTALRGAGRSAAAGRKLQRTSGC